VRKVMTCIASPLDTGLIATRNRLGESLLGLSRYVKSGKAVLAASVKCPQL